MRGENKLKILEFLDNSAETINDLLFFFSLPYGISFRRAEYLLRKYREQKDELEISEKERRNFYTLISRLKKDGLIEKGNKKGGIFVKLTAKGKDILKNLRIEKQNELPGKKYEIQEEKTFKIVAFDIPEAKRKKRAWIRESLRNLKFKMMQKSIWIGKAKLPEEFINNLNKMEILHHVEIFEITKAGTLKQINY